MKTRHKWILPALALAAGGLASAQQTKDGGEWLTYGHDYAETRFSPLRQIDTSNVGVWAFAWSWETESPSGGRVETTPLISNGVLYGSLAWDIDHRSVHGDAFARKLLVDIPAKAICPERFSGIHFQPE
jgi:hypothetical protein